MSKSVDNATQTVHFSNLVFVPSQSLIHARGSSAMRSKDGHDLKSGGKWLASDGHELCRPAMSALHAGVAVRSYGIRRVRAAPAFHAGLRHATSVDPVRTSDGQSSSSSSSS